MSNKPQTSTLHISKAIIKDKTLTATDFVLYAYIKMQYSIQESSTITITRNKFMNDILISDKRTFTKSIDNLIYHGFIINEPLVTNRGLMTIDVNIELFKCESNFAMLPTYLLTNLLSRTGHIGYRLLYFYESYINRTKGEQNMFCYPSYEEITSSLDISAPSLSKYNKLLEDNKLLRITKHVVGTGSTVKDNSLVVFKKYNNHYTPLRGEMNGKNEKRPKGRVTVDEISSVR